MFVCIIIPRRHQRQVISGGVSKMKYCSFGGGLGRRPVELGYFGVSGVAGRGLSVIFFLRRHRREAVPGWARR
jgi:hypothetical protein